MNLTQFKDTAGNVWTMDINIGHYMKFKSELGIDIADSFSQDNNWMAVLAAHEGLDQLLQMLEITLEKQLAAKGLTVEDFYGYVDGNVVASATEALLEGVVLFLPAHKQKAMRIILDSVKVGVNKAMTQVENQQERMMAEAEKIMDQEIDKAMNSGTSTP